MNVEYCMLKNYILINKYTLVVINNFVHNCGQLVQNSL